MAAGPPVCSRCHILYAYNSGGSVLWECPKCEATLKDCEISLWEMPSDEQDRILDRSSEFRDAEKKKRRECLLKRS